MRTLQDNLSSYASYHRDGRNVATHFVGIPAIVLGVTSLLARAAVDAGGVTISAALVAAILTCAFYVVLDRRFGLAMSALTPGFGNADPRGIREGRGLYRLRNGRL